MKNRNVISAFSLLETSVVILIIGIILLAISKSSILVSKYQLSSARSLTKQSPVPTIGNLEIWYEATSKKSFNEIEQENGHKISQWKDINPQKKENNAIANTLDNNSLKPVYVRYCINNLPCIRFNENQHLNFNGSVLANKHYTIFIVEKKSNSEKGYFIDASASNINNGILSLGYKNNNEIEFSQCNNGLTYNLTNAANQQILLHTFRTKNNGWTYNLNSKAQTPSSGLSNYEPSVKLVSYANSTLGGANKTDSHYVGDIAEIIFYSKSLSDTQRLRIEKYLNKKWKLGINFDS